VLAIVAFAGLAATLFLLRGVAVSVEEVPQATPATACGFAPNRAATAHISGLVAGETVPKESGAASG
jgi:hypothetical protein